MFAEIKKSINATLHERLTSPLFGSFILSWLIWNWKIIYLTFFIDSKLLNHTKICIIENQYSDLDYLIFYPLLSTILLITIIPFISVGAFWVTSKFNSMKLKIKQENDNKQLLNIEQSLTIREEINNLKEKHQVIFNEKDSEINKLKAQLKIVKDNNSNHLKTIEANNDELSSNRENIKQYKKVLNENIAKLRTLKNLYKNDEQLNDFINKLIESNKDEDYLPF